LLQTVHKGVGGDQKKKGKGGRPIFDAIKKGKGVLYSLCKRGRTAFDSSVIWTGQNSRRKSVELLEKLSKKGAGREAKPGKEGNMEKEEKKP